MSNTGLAADLSSATTTTPEPCKLCLTINELEPEDADAVRKALANKVAAEHLWKLLKIHGHPTPRRHIYSHIREGHE
jgi:hypothetical protein